VPYMLTGSSGRPTLRPPRKIRPTRVVMLHHFGGHGGAAVMLANIVASLDRRLFDPVVICPAGDAASLFREMGAELRLTPRPLHQFMHISGFSRFILHPRFVLTAFRMAASQSFWRAYVS